MKKKAKQPKLLPCPWCGKTPSLIEAGLMVWLKCNNFRCKMYVETNAYDIDSKGWKKAMKAWNKRKK